MKQDLDNTGETQIQRSITIGKSANELYEFWRDPYNLSEIASEMIQITPTGKDEAHWKMQGILGTGIEWDAKIANDTPGQMIHWQANDNASTPHDLRILFKPAPGDQGTEATIIFRYNPPGGIIGDAVTKLFGIAPELLIHKLLRRFKALVETGEMPTLEYNVSNRKEAKQPGEQK